QLRGRMTWETATSIAYPLLGVVIVITIASVVLIGYRHVAASIWILTAAFTVSSLTDAGYTYFTTVNDEITGDWLSLGWQLTAVLLCLAALCALRQRESDGQVAPPGRDLALVPVLLGVVTAMLATASEARERGVSLAWLAVAGVVLTALVVRF